MTKSHKEYSISPLYKKSGTVLDCHKVTFNDSLYYQQSFSRFEKDCFLEKISHKAVQTLPSKNHQIKPNVMKDHIEYMATLVETFTVSLLYWSDSILTVEKKKTTIPLKTLPLEKKSKQKSTTNQKELVASS